MTRRPKGNYRAYVDKAFSITIFRRWHKNYGDGYKIMSGGKLIIIIIIIIKITL